MSAPKNAGGSRTPLVSYYDVLGVDRSASPEQIKRAWREATDKFEPGSGSGQFRLFGDAADTLLDPERRREYDAELDGEEPTGDASVETAPLARSSARTAPAASTAAAVREDEAAPAEPTRGPRRPTGRRWVVLTAVLTVLAVAAVVTGVLLLGKQRDDAAAADAADQASAAAERSLPAVLSYDYQNLKADRARAVPFLSTSYRKEYTATFDKLIESSDGQASPAAQAKAVVKASVENVGVADAEPDRVRLVVFLNQATTKDGGTPSYSLNRLVVTMAQSGNSWLVDNIVSY